MPAVHRLHYDKHPGRSAPWGWLQLCCVSFAFLSFHWLNFPAWLLQYSGSFIVPYVVGAILLCWPLLFVQLKLGGATQRALISILSHQSPIFKGVGIACILRLCIRIIVDHVTLTYILVYMYESLKSPQPWTTCGHTWNTNTCLSDGASINKTVRPTEEYFFNHVLQVSAGIHQMTSVTSHLVLPLLLSWILTCIMTSGGPRLYGWMTVVFSPLAVLSIIIFLSFGWWMNPTDGRQVLDSFYFRNATYRDEQLTTNYSSTRMWVEGCNQMVTVLSLPHGLMSAVGKYAGNKPEKINLSWVFILLFSLVLPPFLIVVISPYLRGWSISSLYIHRGVEFASLTISANMATFGVSTYWSFLFFVIVYIFGLLYVSLLLLVIISAIVSALYLPLKETHRTLSRRMLRIILSISICILGFLLGLFQITQGGWYLYQLVQHFVDRLNAVYLTLLLPGLLVAYGMLPISEVEKHVIGFWFGAASFVLILFGILPMALGYETTWSLSLQMLDVEYSYPSWAVAVGWLIATAPLLIGLLAGCIHIVTSREGSVSQRLRNLVIPASSEAEDTWSVMDAYSTDPHPVSTITRPYLQVAPQASVAYRLSDNPERTYL